jgi:hypothetical protein
VANWRIHAPVFLFVCYSGLFFFSLFLNSFVYLFPKCRAMARRIWTYRTQWKFSYASFFQHHYPLLRKYRQRTYGKSGKAGQYAVESTWNGMSVRQPNDSILNASLLSIVRCSCIHQCATCIDRSSGNITANHNRLTDLEEADTWKVADPLGRE